MPSKGARGHQEGCLYFCFKPLSKEGCIPDLGHGAQRQGPGSWPHLARQESLVSWVSWLGPAFSVNQPVILGWRSSPWSESRACHALICYWTTECLVPRTGTLDDIIICFLLWCSWWTWGRSCNKAKKQNTKTKQNKKPKVSLLVTNCSWIGPGGLRWAPFS